MSKIGWTRSVLAVAMAAFVCACGDAKNGAPVGAVITFTPADFTLGGLTASAVCGDGTYVHNHDMSFAITVTDESGVPLNDIDMDLVLEMSLATSTHDWMRLYNDINENLAADPGEEVSGVWRTKTGAFGQKYVVVRGDASCNFTGSLKAYSGSAYAFAEITFTP